jgi:hypothetical protein
MDSIVLNVSVTEARMWDWTSNSVIALMKYTVAQGALIRRAIWLNYRISFNFLFYPKGV